MANSWAGLTAAPALGMAAVITWTGGTGSAWVSTGSGRHLLDIVQVGVRAGPAQPGGAAYPDAGPHFFAAWGAGEPAKGEYTEVDLGPAKSGPHRFAVKWTGRTWDLSVDGVLRRRVPARPWTAQNVRAMAESHGGPLPHVAIEKVRRMAGRAWTTAGLSYIATGTNERPDWGLDWMRTV